jgi:NADH:ubiquinone oxidoreductase subunit 4 (subunit M)
LSPREWLVIAPVVAMAIFMGLVPNVFLRPTAASIDKVVERLVPVEHVVSSLGAER